MTEAQQSGGDPPETVAAPRRVVVCDADEISARLLARVLGGAGLPVTTCTTAAECETAVEGGGVALVILAILLPDLDGLALARRLRGHDPSPAILIVSALQAEQRALEAGANAFLLKPVSGPRLLTTVDGLLATGIAP